MIPKKEDSKKVNIIEVITKDEMFKCGLDEKKCWAIVLKEMLWIFVEKIGKGGCPICIIFFTSILNKDTQI